MAVVLPVDAPRAPDDARGLVGAWTRTDLLSSLSVVVDAIVDNAGFTVADVRARNGRDELYTVVATDLGNRAASSVPPSVAQIEYRLARAEHWGPLCFVARDPRPAATRDADEWHPGDALYAPFRDEDGALIGLLSVERPADGRRPSEQTCQHLASLAFLAERAVAEALAAERAAGRSRASSAARAVVRRAAAHVDLPGLFDDVLAAVLVEFGALGAWTRLLSRSEQLHVSKNWVFPEPIPDWLVVDLMAAGARCWESQQLLEISAVAPPSDLVTEAAYTYLVDRYTAYGLGSLLQVPLGAGGQFLGYLIVARPAGSPPWGPEELDECLGLGHDLGSAVLNAQTFGRERRLVEELRQVDDFKRDLVSLFSHELRTPLTSLGGHLELLELDLGDLEIAATPLAAMRRAVDRLGDMMQDLVLLSRLIEPGRPLVFTQTELGSLVAEATTGLSEMARSRSATLRVDLPSEPIMVDADGAALTRAFATLVADLVDFTPPDGVVAVTLETVEGRAVLTISESGRGARSAAKARLFGAVLRGIDPAAQAYPGGLDLRITERILTRHDGLITFTADSGAGSQLRLSLPLLGDD